jgi:predicted transcriptional regulator
MDINWNVLEEAGVPDSQLARFAQVSRSAVLYWKRGVNTPTDEMAGRIKAFLAIVEHADHNGLLEKYRSARKTDKQRLLMAALLEARRQLKEKRDAPNDEGISGPDTP